jgi:hypothetical protein
MKIKFFVVGLVLSVFHSINVSGQSLTGNEKIDYDVNGALGEFMNFDDYVDLSTGKMHPSFDLIHLEGVKLKSNVSITYDSGSNRVNEIGGILVQGWSLNAGGYIVREVRGLPDDSKPFNSIPTLADQQECYTFQCYFDKGYLHMGAQGKAIKKGYLDTHNRQCTSLSNGNGLNLSGCLIDRMFGNYDENYTYAEMIDDFFAKPIINQTYPRVPGLFPNGDEWCRVNGQLCISDLWSTFYSAVFNWGYYGGIEDYKYDTEPDVFSYNLGNGITGQFVFDSDSRPVSIPENDIKIEPALGKHGGNSWIFTTPDGTKYYFENSDLYREEKWEYYDNSPWIDNDGMVYPSFMDESRTINRYISKWHMSKIVHQSGEEITFTYRNQPDMEYSLYNPVKLDYHPSNNWGVLPEWGTSKLYNRTDQFFHRKRKSIRRITSELGEIEFNYQFSPASMSNLHHVQSITRKNYLNNEVQRFNLSYETSTSSNCNTTQSSARYYLKYVQEVAGGSSKPRYEFKYNSLKLPCMSATTQDYWGYFNRKGGVNLIPPTTSYVGFAPHYLSGADRTPDLLGSKARILEEVTSPLGGVSVFEYELNDAAAGNSNVTIGGGLRIASITNYTTTARNDGTRTSFTYRRTNNPSLSSATKMDLGKNHDMNYLYFNWSNINQPNGPEYKIYTVRSKNSRYHQYLGEPVRYSTVTVKETNITGSTSNGKTVFHMTDFNTNPDLQPLHYVADEQDLVTGFELKNSSSVFTTSNPAAPKISKRFERGVVKKIEVFNTSNQLVKEETFDYSFKSTDDPIYGFRISNPYEIFWYPLNYTSPQGAIEIYHHAPGIYSLDRKTTKSYGVNGSAPVAKTVDYIYDNDYPTLVTSQSTQLSDGDTELSQYKYAFDYTGSMVMRNMVRNNIISNPIEVVTKRNNKVIDADIYKYDCFNCTFLPYDGGLLVNGVFEISEVLQLDIASPITNYQFATSSLVPDTRYKTAATFGKYDNRGNPLEVKKFNGPTSSYIMGYKKKYPIALIENATYSQIEALSSFGSNFNISSNLNSTQRSQLRGLSNTLVTTFEYKPLVGATKVTDPKGMNVTYIYDEFNRLRQVKDETGKILSQSEYNYKN